MDEPAKVSPALQQAGSRAGAPAVWSCCGRSLACPEAGSTGCVGVSVQRRAGWGGGCGQRERQPRMLSFGCGAGAPAPFCSHEKKAPDARFGGALEASGRQGQAQRDCWVQLQAEGSERPAAGWGQRSGF